MIQKLDFYYGTNQINAMKIFISSLIVLFSFCFTSCVEEEGGANSGQNKPRDSKFLVPTEAQSSCQLEQHKSTDKMLVASKKSNKAPKTREDRSQAREEPYGGESTQWQSQSAGNNEKR
jgi:hypothetical protein